MTSASDQSSASAPDGSASSARSLEFAEALDRYIASYAAEERIRHEKGVQVLVDGRKAPRRQSAMRQLGGFIALALTCLGKAMSAGGRSTPVGIM
jgi:hypothetical protein